MASATLLASLASDLDVVNSARVSQGKHSDTFEHPGDTRLIKYLMSRRHGTPFEHNYFRFHVVVPIFAQRDWMRHRVGHSFNEVSTRWQDMDALGVYEPDLLREQIGRPHEYLFEDFDPATASLVAKARHAQRRRYLIRSQQKAMKRYKRMLKRGYAREQAMATLPMGTYTEFYWSCNARSLMHFLGLRTGESVRKEIRQVCTQIERSFQAEMPVTYEAFVDSGRVAP